MVMRARPNDIRVAVCSPRREASEKALKGSERPSSSFFPSSSASSQLRSRSAAEVSASEISSHVGAARLFCQCRHPFKGGHLSERTLGIATVP